MKHLKPFNAFKRDTLQHVHSQTHPGAHTPTHTHGRAGFSTDQASWGFSRMGFIFQRSLDLHNISRLSSQPCLTHQHQSGGTSNKPSRRGGDSLDSIHSPHPTPTGSHIPPLLSWSGSGWADNGQVQPTQHITIQIQGYEDESGSRHSSSDLQWKNNHSLLRLWNTAVTGWHPCLEAQHTH